MRSDAHQLWLDPLSVDSWRLCDRSVASNDADSVVAYIELRADGTYGVTWVARGIGARTYTTLADLLRDAAELLSTPVHHGPLKPIPISHRPPAAV